MAEVCVDDSVGQEYVAHLREQSGFEPARRVVPTTRRPQDFSVAIVGSGMIGLNAAIKLGQAGFRYRVFEARDDLGGRGPATPIRVPPSTRPATSTRTPSS